MEAFYDIDSGSIEAHLDDAGFKLVALDLPSWYINSDIKTAFASRSEWDSVSSNAPSKSLLD
jgi:hypothetical protein